MVIQLLLLLQISLLTSLWSLSCSVILGVASSPSLAKPNCPSHCGTVEIPYPFGTGLDCFDSDEYYYVGFEILCDNSTNPPKPFLNLTDGSRREVLEISLEGTLKVTNPIFFSDCPNKPNNRQTSELLRTFMRFSGKNKFISVSCGSTASLTDLDLEQVIAVCYSICSEHFTSMYNGCGGINCCQAILPYNTQALNTSFGPFIKENSIYTTETPCKYAFLVDPEWFTSNSTNTSAIAEMEYVPIVLDWFLYRLIDDSTEDNVTRNCESEQGPCSCAKGYQGNPYLSGRCQGNF
ncbi:hypothetical protein ACLB2K_054435 [Fragaria x ananassa]